MGVKDRGPANIWECTTCGDQHVGTPGTKLTNKWISFHRVHVQSGHGVWYDPERSEGS